jgi:hypothetical protein
MILIVSTYLYKRNNLREDSYYKYTSRPWSSIIRVYPTNIYIYLANRDSGDVSVKETNLPQPSPNDEARTISDLIRGIVQSPSDVTKSINSVDEILLSQMTMIMTTTN